MSTAIAADAAAGLGTRFFQGTLGADASAPSTVFNLPGWTSAYAHVLVVMQDVNSNTNQLFYDAQFACVRQWDQAPQLTQLNQQFSHGTGLYSVNVAFDGANDFVVTVVQGGFDTVTSWKVQVDYMMGR